MKSRNIRWITILGMATVAAVILFQVTWLSKTYRLKEQENSQAISLALYSVARQMAEFKGITFPNENPVVQLSPTYFVVNINDVIDPRILDHFLHIEFTHRGLDFNYEYAIYDCATDQMVYAGTSEDEALRKENKNGPDFHQLPEFTYYFGINFPDLPKETASDLRFWFFSASLLVLAVIFFSYALFVIFRQRRLSEIQRDFVNAMTHEFKTPISTLRIAADVLKEESITKEPARLQRYGSIISEQVRQLQSHVERVLDTARIDSKSIVLQPSDIDIKQLISEVSSQYSELISKQNGTFNLELSPEAISIRADEVHLSGVIHNLLDNAVKFAASPPLIELRVMQKMDEIAILISDNGPGIPKSERKKIFKKYYRVSEGRVSSHRGFGLGLFYVYKVARAHGWKIRIKNGKNGGAEFALEIPLCK